MRRAGEEPHDCSEDCPQNDNDIGNCAKRAEFEPSIGVDTSSAYEELDGEYCVAQITEENAACDDTAIYCLAGDIEDAENSHAQPGEEDRDDGYAQVGVDARYATG